MVALLAVASLSFGVPQILIFRLKPEKAQSAFDAPICDALANELQAQGRVLPIVWSLTDPMFRAAVEAGKVRSMTETPALKEVLNAAAKFGAEYVLATEVLPGQGSIFCAAYLYQRGKLVWKDPNVDINSVLAHLREMLKKKAITKETYDDQALHARYREMSVQLERQFGLEDTIKSMARTWIEMMNSGPLINLQPQHVKTTPEPAHGEAPKTVVPQAPDDKWRTEVDKALKGGDAVKAVTLIRDAIDSSPLEPSRRVFLIHVLQRSGSPEVAAQEARRASALMPERIEFYELAARSWIEAGNLDEAILDLNEAVARAPESGPTLVLLADVSIYRGNFEAAIGYLDKVISSAPSGDAYYLRAVARVMAGDLDQANGDLAKSEAAGLSKDPEEAESRYDLVAALFDGSLTSLGNDVRDIQQRALVQRSDSVVVSGAADLNKRVFGRASFIASLTAPASHETSHNRRVLAYKLLSQCLTDLASFLKSGDEDVLTDSRINLGEALKQMASARLKFKEEQQGAKKSDDRSG